MPQSERWNALGREILFSARTELYMSLPFLDAALSALAVSDGFDTDDRFVVGCPAGWNAAARASTAPTCTACFTVCCAIPPKRTAATAICGIWPVM